MNAAMLLTFEFSPSSLSEPQALICSPSGNLSLFNFHSTLWCEIHHGLLLSPARRSLLEVHLFPMMDWLTKQCYVHSCVKVIGSNASKISHTKGAHILIYYAAWSTRNLFLLFSMHFSMFPPTVRPDPKGGHLSPRFEGRLALIDMERKAFVTDKLNVLCKKWCQLTKCKWDPSLILTSLTITGANAASSSTLSSFSSASPRRRSIRPEMPRRL